MTKYLLTLFCLFLFFSNSFSQTVQDENYNFFVDLNNVTNDQLVIELITPKITSDKISYKFPAMVPGTYKVYDFGRYVSNLKAFDESGNELSVTHPGVNEWEISDAGRLHKITYTIDDTFEDTLSDNRIFEPVGTSIEEGKIFVVNNQLFFGYFDDYLSNDYKLNFKKPQGFYGSTSLVAIDRTDTEEIFTAPDYQFLVDNPMFFSNPDTTTINFDESRILITVYSPGKGITSKDLAEKNKVLLEAIRKYLGGKLTADRYTFLYYFTNSMHSTSFGALEHNYSSLYYMPDVPKENKSYMLNQLNSTSAHEFYHTVTPLNLHSEEIGNFDFNNPVMSEHLWLYEGVTEYSADYIQLRGGMMTLSDYASTMETKLNGAARHNDSLPFTELSKGALDVHEDQYLNVYLKGALIGLCLDILIREQSNGQMGLQDVINKLLEKYGKEKSFRDEDLFSEIETMTSPKVREFLDMYVAGPNRIPYDEIFGKVGFNVKRDQYQVVDVGSVSMGFNQKNYRLVIRTIDLENSFVKQLGIKTGDEPISVNGTALTYFNVKGIFGSMKKPSKIGDEFVVVVARYDDKGNETKETLKAKVDKTKTAYDYEMEVEKNPTEAQMKLRKAWLQAN